MRPKAQELMVIVKCIPIDLLYQIAFGQRGRRDMLSLIDGMVTGMSDEELDQFESEIKDVLFTQSYDEIDIPDDEESPKDERFSC